MLNHWFVILVFFFGLLHGIEAEHLMSVLAVTEQEDIRKKLFLISSKTAFLHVSLFLVVSFAFSYIGSPTSLFRVISGVSLFAFGIYASFIFFFCSKKIHQHDHAHEHTHGHPLLESGESRKEKKGHKHPLPVDIDSGKSVDNSGHVHSHEHDHQHLHVHVEGNKHEHSHYRQLLSRLFQKEDIFFILGIGVFGGVFSSILSCAILLFLGMVFAAYINGVFYRMGGIEFMEKCTNTTHLISGVLAVVVSLCIIF